MFREASLVDAGGPWSTPMNQTSGLAVGRQRRGAVGEAGGHDDVVALIDELLDVRDRRPRGRGDEGDLTGDAKGGGRLLGARVRVFIEVLVVDLADVRRNTDLDLRRVGRERSFLPPGAWQPRRMGLAPPTRRGCAGEVLLHAATTKASPLNSVSPNLRVRMFPPPASWSRLARPSRRARYHDGSISDRSCGPTLARILPAWNRPGK